MQKNSEADLNWDDLRFVLQVARGGNLSAAAEALGVTHTTVSRRLSRLEEQLGTRLFDRSSTGHVPTDAGLSLTELAESIETRVNRTQSEVRGRDAELAGPLRLSTLDFLFETFVDVFASFQDRYPAIDLTVTCTETEVSLFQRQADVALRLTNTPPDTLIGRHVGNVCFAVYGHHRLVADTPELADLPWLHWDERLEPVTRWMDGWLAEIAPGATIALRLGENTLARRAALLRGLGIHPLPCFEGERFEELVRISPVLHPFTRQLWVLALPAMRNNRRVRALLAHVAESLADHPALVAPEP